MLLQYTYWIFLIGCGAYVLRFGNCSEKWGIALIGGGSLLSVASTSGMAERFRHAELGIFAIDVLVLGAFFVLALRTNKLWPLWVTGFQLVAVATHLAIMVEPEAVPCAYALAQGFWAYPMLILIALSASANRRRRKNPTAST